MTRPICILISLSLMVAIAGLASTASAECASCGGGAEENWAASAATFLEGKSIEDNPAPRWGPSVARETNSQFSNNKTEEAAGNASEEPSSAPEESTSSAEATATTAQNIDLLNATASPNPANPGSPVSINAVLGYNTTAYAIIRNFSGVQVGNVTLEHTSGNEYVGSWNAGIATGAYTISIVASESGMSRTFENALQIEVVDSSSDSGTSSRFKKLG